MSGSGIEYNVVSVAANDLPTLTSELNTLGNSGWEVVSVLPQAGSSHILYLKKKDK